MGMVNAVLKWVDHNRYLVTVILVGLVISIMLIACQPMTTSVLSPPDQVTGTELEREAVIIAKDAESKLQQLEIAKVDIERKLELRAKIIEVAGGIGQAVASGALNPATGAAAVLQIITLAAAGGAIADNRRKDKVIAKGKEDKAVVDA